MRGATPRAVVRELRRDIGADLGLDRADRRDLAHREIEVRARRRRTDEGKRPATGDRAATELRADLHVDDAVRDLRIEVRVAQRAERVGERHARVDEVELAARVAGRRIEAAHA